MLRGSGRVVTLKGDPIAVVEIGDWEYVQRAVNAHEELVTALKQTEAELRVIADLIVQPATDPLAWVDNCSARIRSLLARIEGK